MYNTIISSPIGGIHTLLGFAALFTGTAVLLKEKGTKSHKNWGYAYCISMLLMLLTAFGIYRLFNGFGVFHALALLSLVTLFGGMYPAFKRWEGWYMWHLSFMSWSVVGLYAAFAAEISVRFFPAAYFGYIVAITTACISIIGNIVISGIKKKANTSVWMKS